MKPKTALISLCAVALCVVWTCSDWGDYGDDSGPTGPTCDPTLSFGQHDSVEALSQTHRSVLVTWPAQDDTVGVSHFMVYRSVATDRDSCDGILFDTAAENFLAVRNRAHIHASDTSFEDIIDLMDAVYWYGVKAVLADSTDLWLGYDSATIRNAYEYNPLVETSSLEMKNVLLSHGSWARAGCPAGSTPNPCWALDFDTAAGHDLVNVYDCDGFTTSGSCDVGASSGLPVGVRFGTSELRDTLFVTTFASTDTVAYHMEFMPNGSLTLARDTAVATLIDTALTNLLDTLGPVFKGAASWQ